MEDVIYLSHYGEKVELVWLHDIRAFLDQEKCQLLPIVERNAIVAKMDGENGPIYTIIERSTSRAYQTRSLPEDGDIKAFLYDMSRQIDLSKEPMKMPSLFVKLYDTAEKAANERIKKGELSNRDRLYLEKMTEMIREKEKARAEAEKDSDDPFSDTYDLYVSGWTETAIQEETESRLRNKLMADYLNSMGFDYETMEKLATKTDDKREELYLLKDGYYYYKNIPFFQRYLQEENA
ncbi:hypothetical protein LKD70_17465 [Ruminococcus sp. CLA-AA-H200]|uniref:Uncharacterized protein n=1 Tax=Ruminococcus turbiniformis TaxID=2881258 RepID=A0ABS8G1I8_9FIRM|nr:hypothetical protein [Ruminococcus turbiniformis]MCC2256173.1 hypothetical protein [Ruminococcus turbiniformis]